MQNLPPRLARDLETAIVWLKEAAEKVAEVENHTDSTRSIRELASDARAGLKATLMLFKEVRSLSEDLSNGNGQGQSEETQASG